MRCLRAGWHVQCQDPAPVVPDHVFELHARDRWVGAGQDGAPDLQLLYFGDFPDAYDRHRRVGAFLLHSVHDHAAVSVGHGGDILRQLAGFGFQIRTLEVVR